MPGGFPEHGLPAACRDARGSSTHSRAARAEVGQARDGPVLEGQDDVAFLNQVPGWKKWGTRPRGTARTRRRGRMVGATSRLF